MRAPASCSSAASPASVSAKSGPMPARSRRPSLRRSWAMRRGLASPPSAPSWPPCAGSALGASLENTLVVSDDRVLNPEGLRFADEFVRHKALDAIGDLALAGAPILGAYRSVCGGHKLNHAVLTALIADPTAWTIVEEGKPRARRHAELPAGIMVPAY